MLSPAGPCARADPPHRPRTGTAITAANFMDLRNISFVSVANDLSGHARRGPESRLAVVVARIAVIYHTRAGAARLVAGRGRASGHHPAHALGGVVGADVPWERPPQPRLAVTVEHHVHLA